MPLPEIQDIHDFTDTHIETALTLKHVISIVKIQYILSVLSTTCSLPHHVGFFPQQHQLLKMALTLFKQPIHYPFHRNLQS